MLLHSVLYVHNVRQNDFADLFASLMYATVMVNIVDVHICVGLTQAFLNSIW